MTASFTTLRAGRYLPPPTGPLPAGALTLSEAARELGCNHSSVRARLERAGLEPRLPTGALGITRAQLQELRDFEDARLDRRIPADDLITLTEAARLRGCREAGGLRRRLTRHGIPIIKRGSSALVSLTDLERYDRLITPPGVQQATEPPARWVRVPEVARQAGIPQGTLALWCKRGRVPAVMCKAAYYVDPQAVEHYLASRRPPAGWVLVAKLCTDPARCAVWLRAHGHEVRRCMGPGCEMNYTTPSGAQAWRTRPRAGRGNPDPFGSRVRAA